MLARLAVSSAFLLVALHAHAGMDPDCTRADEPVLCAYEPNSFGFTRDSYAGHGFLDVRLSLRYQLFPRTLTKYFGEHANVFLAFSTRFGQYLWSDSAPVIGKRFNPKIFERYELDSGRLDIGYAHESNGQSINSAQEFQLAQASPRDAEFARDQISRGWDYLELELKHGPRPPEGQKEEGFYWYGNLKYFLPNGLLQGKAEEYNDFENDPEGKPRNEVNGVAGMVKRIWRGTKGPFTDAKLALRYETGYDHMFKYNTVRVEAATKLMELPVNLWAQNGYNTNLAYYYKRLSSWGIEVQIGSF